MPKTSETTLQLRRSPKLVAFLVTFALIGLIASLAVALVVGVAGTFLLFVLAFGTAFVTFVGWVAYVILDAIFSRRSKAVSATKIEG